MVGGTQSMKTAMSDHRSDDDQDLRRTANRATPAAGPDERDAAIERLERIVADQRRHTTQLCATIEDLRFKNEILEKSYAKQLADARLRTEAAERRAAEQQVQIADLERLHDEATRALTIAQAELKRYTHVRGSTREAAARDSLQSNLPAVHDADSAAEEGTINRLMDDWKWLRERQQTEEEKARLAAKAHPAEEAPIEEMIAPELLSKVGAGKT
jgi:hypothetical protein